MIVGALTTLQYDDVGIASDSLALLQTWKNVPDMVHKTTNITNSCKKKYKLNQPVEDIKVRMCDQKQETVSHIMCACWTIAQSLYTPRHDKIQSDKMQSDHSTIIYSIRVTLRTVAPNHGAN